MEDLTFDTPKKKRKTSSNQRLLPGPREITTRGRVRPQEERRNVSTKLLENSLAYETSDWRGDP